MGVNLVIITYYTMTEDVKKSSATPPEKDSKKKSVFTKLKEGIDDKEEQLAILSTFVRLGVVVWSGWRSLGPPDCADDRVLRAFGQRVSDASKTWAEVR